jgi:hypothetical protein
MVVGQSHYSVGKKYCRRCECYFVTPEVCCERCGMQPRANPHCGRVYKEKVRAKKRDSVGIQRNYRPDWKGLKSWKTYHSYMKKISLEFASVLITGLGLFLLSTIQVSAQPLVTSTPTGTLTDGVNISINPEEPLPANGTVSISTEGAIDSDMNVIPPEGVTVIIENDTVTVTNQTVDIETADEDEEEAETEDEGEEPEAETEEIGTEEE